MGLVRKSELAGVALNFAEDGRFVASTTWNVGVWDDALGAWAHLPETKQELLESTSTPDMKRYNDALGVAMAECVYRTQEYQARLADQIKENDEQRAHIAELLAEQKILTGQLEFAKASYADMHKGWADEERAHAEFRARIRRLTFGLLGR